MTQIDFDDRSIFVQFAMILVVGGLLLILLEATAFNQTGIISGAAVVYGAWGLLSLVVGCVVAVLFVSIHGPENADVKKRVRLEVFIMYSLGVFFWYPLAEIFNRNMYLAPIEVHQVKLHQKKWTRSTRRKFSGCELTVTDWEDTKATQTIMTPRSFCNSVDLPTAAMRLASYLNASGLSREDKEEERERARLINELVQGTDAIWDRKARRKARIHPERKAEFMEEIKRRRNRREPIYCLRIRVRVGGLGATFYEALYQVRVESLEECL